MLLLLCFNNLQKVFDLGIVHLLLTLRELKKLLTNRDQTVYVEAYCVLRILALVQFAYDPRKDPEAKKVAVEVSSLF